MNIWFIPTAVTHVDRFRDVMEGFRERGDSVRLFCVDSALQDTNRCIDRIRSSGYPFRRLPQEVCNPAPHWALESLNNARLARSLRGAWRELDMDCLVIGGDFGFVRQTIIRTAVDLSIPIVHIMDGLVVPPNPRPRAPKPRKPTFKYLLPWRWQRFDRKLGDSGADLVLVMNLTGRDDLIRNGVPAERVKLVGSPAHDRFVASVSQTLPPDNRELIQRLGLPQGKPVVLYAAQELDHKPLIRQMMPGVKRCRAVLLVKFHPREPNDLRTWREWAMSQGFGPGDIVFSRDELSSFDALRLSDLCVTVFSTVAVEALIIGKPVVYIQYMDCDFSLSYGSSYGAGIDAGSPEELQDAIERLLRDKVLRQQIIANGYVAAKEEMAGLVGGSLRRTIEEITALVARRTELRCASIP